LDWKINNNHRATLRYNYSKSGEQNPVNATSSDVGGGLASGRHARTGGMSFENSRFRSEGIMHSVTGELNSRFSDQLSNNLLIAFTNYDQPRDAGDIFPSIDIMRQGTNPLMSAGFELFSFQNRVRNNTFIITNNATLQHGRHTLTAGLSFEHQYFSNTFMRNGTGYFRYANFQAFQNHALGLDPYGWNGASFDSNYHPIGFAWTYGLGGNTEPKAELGFGQFAAYIQDEWSVTDNFRLTLGLRMDLPMYFDGALDNPQTHGETFKNGQTIDLATWPKVRPLWSPRVGFNWNVYGDRSLTLRGGTGIFTGRIPFVWFVNQPLNSGVIQRLFSTTADSILVQIPFTPDINTLKESHSDLFPTTNVLREGRLATVDKNFRLPQVWRTSLSADIRLPLNMMLTLEAIYSKDINAVGFENINIEDPNSTILEGSHERDFFADGRQWVNTRLGADLVKMINTNYGQSVSLSAQLRLPYWNGFSGNLAYTFSYAEEAFFRSGNDPFAAWGNRPTINNLNAPELGLTLNNTPHRVMASLNYHVQYARNFATTISLFYVGSSGAPFSFVYNNSHWSTPRPNGYPTGTYLAFLPENRDDVIWYNGDEDWNAYQNFINLNPELKDLLGTVPTRTSVNLPWNNRFDLRIAQEFKINVGNRVNRLTFTADILNVANLLNSNWGIAQQLNGTWQNFQILNFHGRDAATDKAIVSMMRTGGRDGEAGLIGDPVTTYKVNPGSQWSGSTPNVWAIQLGLRYTF
jgi:hypothetical protein